MSESKIDLRAIKRELDKMICPAHKKHAEITVKNEGFEITCCCCDSFHESIDKKAFKLIDENTKKIISDTMNNLFQ